VGSCHHCISSGCEVVVAPNRPFDKTAAVARTPRSQISSWETSQSCTTHLVSRNSSPVTNLPSENIFKVVRRWGRDYYPIYKNWIAYTGAANVMDPCDFEVSTICIRSHPNKFVDCFEQHEAHRKGDDLRDDAPMARYRLVDQYW
jgi:hypothetical protein